MRHSRRERINPAPIPASRPFWVALSVVAGVVAGSGLVTPHAAPSRAADAGTIFADDFERGLSRWQVLGPSGVTIRDSGDPGHGAVMELTPNGDVVALVRGSDVWDLVRLELVGARAEVTTHEGRPSIRLLEAERTRLGGLALLRAMTFTDGVIELDVAGRRGPHAVPDDRGFIGVAFRTRPGAAAYEYVYLRPDNGRAADQVRRNHSTQYAAHPDFGFDRLRRESPERYEAPQPALVVTDLKLGTGAGGVALWIGPGTEGFFSNLRITPAP